MHLLHSLSVRSPYALAFTRELHVQQAALGLQAGPMFRPKLLAWVFQFSRMYDSSIAESFKLVPLRLNNTIWAGPLLGCCLGPRSS